MHEIHQRRVQLQQLTDRLVLEYAGALPAGQVLAAVTRAQRRVGGAFWSAERTNLCETLARDELTRRLTLAGAAMG